MKGVFFLHLAAMLRSAATLVSNCNKFRSNPGIYLKNHVFNASQVPGLQQCTRSCVCHPHCKSTNFDFVNKTCELNNADKFDFPSDLVSRQGFSYSGWKNKEQNKIFKSCSDIKRTISCVQSGYYTVEVRGKQREVYCDMENFGGGWTLVVLIDHASNRHLKSRQTNCFNSIRCVNRLVVTNELSAMPSRKLSDDDIRALASDEGTFRGDVIGSNPYTVFFQIPGGAEHFDSECAGDAKNCPRVIVSHEYPYKWESNCKGLSIGYMIGDTHPYRVFDTLDNLECGGKNRWTSSKHKTNRFLYGYENGKNTGILPHKPGMLYVR